jgi:hypothetical protein
MWTRTWRARWNRTVGQCGRKPRVSPAPDTTPALHRGTLENTVDDIPLTLTDALFAVAFGLALGALVALGL